MKTMSLYWGIFWSFLQKAWTYLRKYWQVLFAIVVSVLGYFFYRKNQVDFANQLQKIQSQHDEELLRIEKARRDERAAHEANIKRLEATMVEIQKQYEAAKQILEDQKKAEIKEIVKQYGDNPTGLAQKLSEVTGFNIVLPE